MATLSDLLTNRIPPHSLEAERAVLGGMLLDRESLSQAIELLKPSDFYKEGHRKIFTAVLDIAATGNAADLITVTERLRQQGELEATGGVATLGLLVEEATTLVHVDSYAAIVRDKASLRELIRLSTNVIGRAYDNGVPPAELVTTAARELEELARRAAPREEAPVGKVLRGPELFAVPIVQPDWMIQQLFSWGHQHMLVAASQGAKTWALFGLGVAVSHPSVSYFLGHAVCAHGRVEIESWEQGQAEDVRRLQKLLRGHGLDAGAEDLTLISDPPTTLSDESYFARRRRELTERGVRLYLIDSLSEAAGMELNDNTAYTQFWRRRVKPLLDLGITVVFTHLRGHLKPGVAQDRDSASRGATQIRALSTGVLEFRQLADTLFAVKHNKHRDGTALSFGHLELEGSNDDDWIRLTLREAGGDGGMDALARRLLTTLGRETALTNTSLTRKRIEAALNDPSRPKTERVSKKIYEAVLDKMVAAGLFNALKVGNADHWTWIGPAQDEEDEVPF
jgi:DnaB-like helicase N terminal domain/AAA domain